MTVPYIFASATAPLPLSQLDSNFATAITLGTTSLTLGSTVTSVAGLTLTGATLGGTFSGTSVTDSGLTSGRVTYAGTGGLLQDSANLTFNGTTLTTANDASIHGLTVGLGGGSVSSNTVVGSSALVSNSTGNENTAIGFNALAATTTGYDNFAGGFYALKTNTSGINNTASGSYALYSNTTASQNSAFGASALIFNTIGANNTAVGSSALASNTTASNNTAVGYQAGYSNQTGTANVFLGQGTGYTNLTGISNCFIGTYAGRLSTGSYNTFIGSGQQGVTDGSGGQITTGSYNTILGLYSGNQGGLDIRTASNYIVLSDGAGNPRLVLDNNGYASIGSTTPAANAKNSQLLLKSSDISATAYGLTIVNNANSTGGKFINFVNYNDATAGSISQATSTTVLFNTTSDYRLKTVVGSITDSGQRIDALEPIEFDWTIGGRTKGFLAHKFAEVYPNSVTGEKDALDAEGKPIYQQMQASTSEVMADLIAEIQSLRKRVAQLESK